MQMLLLGPGCHWVDATVSCSAGSGACLLSLLPACKLHKILPGYKSILLFTEYVICGECSGSSIAREAVSCCWESERAAAEPTKVFSNICSS